MRMFANLQAKANILGIISADEFQKIFADLVRMVGGDIETANRLISFEQRQHPFGNMQILVEHAIERLVSDRR